MQTKEPTLAVQPSNNEQPFEFELSEGEMAKVAGGPIIQNGEN